MIITLKTTCVVDSAVCSPSRSSRFSFTNFEKTIILVTKTNRQNTI